MIGIMLTSKIEFENLLDLYNITSDYLNSYPFGEYYKTTINNKEVVFFRSNSRKVSASAATQYMIDKFNLEKLLHIGTCTLINDELNYGDIIIPHLLAEYDLTIRELEPLIKENNIIKLKKYDLDLDYYEGLLITSDKALVTNKDLSMVKETDALAADTESAAIAKVAKLNNVDFICIKGVTDGPMNNYEEQLEVYNENQSFVINKILQEYLMEFIN